MTKPPYSDEQVELALACVVACGGSIGQAKKLLDEKDLKIDPRTLEKWVNATHVERYAKLAEQHGPQLEEAIVRQVRELAVRAAISQGMALNQLEKQLSSNVAVGPAEAAKIARDLSHVVGQNVDKLLTLTGRPTEIIEERSAVEILRGPVLRNFVRVVDGSAEEVPELDAGEGKAA